MKKIKYIALALTVLLVACDVPKVKQVEESTPQAAENSSSESSEETSASTSNPDTKESSSKDSEKDSEETEESKEADNTEVSNQGESVDGNGDSLTTVPETEAKPESYFADALFIGDSRTQSLMLYGSLYDADFISTRGYNAPQYFSEVISINGTETTGTDFVSSKENSYNNVYLMLGTNELGYDLGVFIENYRAVIKDVKAKQANANIYLNAILPVTKSKDDTNDAWGVKNSNIVIFNKALRQLADEEGIYFLDASAAIANELGYLPEDISPDGVHFDKSTVDKWQKYIQTHVA
ncbi:GDSL-type esterase/lipase family protein [Fastidiosipila sanguinis]|uniref:SGNH hydrolase-type esterase domain-containing protein n=1 Tax=Fastidiosipila sanguinis TaxID=236753 RepID=A0A2S0KLT7_9FIRM|nr:GDSL-type esterase/lipase family protein [Fastidiosipila sanguinis]AVM41978.1 hypothetical protein C5Q98_01425 [Fastidiosipila sanguinis]